VPQSDSGDRPLPPHRGQEDTAASDAIDVPLKRNRTPSRPPPDREHIAERTSKWLRTAAEAGLTRRDRALLAPVHQARTSAILGVALGVSFTICFLTGLYSHLIQHPSGFFSNPARPAGLYRFTQGLHVTTGIISVPLLLAKLWAAFPHLFQTPPVRNVAHALERISIAILVAGSLFMLASGLTNSARWYPFPFSFVPAHYAVAWITIGALTVHIGAKATISRRALFRAQGQSADLPSTGVAPAGALTRRGFLGATAAGAGILTLTTVGQTVEPLKDLAGLAPRRPDQGVDGVPVNKPAAQAGVTDTARSPGYRVLVDGKVKRKLDLTVEDLRGMEQHTARLAITCVEGWSVNATWTGVPLRDLLRLAGAADHAAATVYSLETRSIYSTSEVDSDHAADRDTLLALKLNGNELHLDHGFPVRLIAPNRPGVMQTKWVNRIEVK